MTPLMEILQNRISTVACKTLRVSHISHRPHHQLINEPDSTLKKLVPCPKNGEHLKEPFRKKLSWLSRCWNSFPKGRYS